MQKSLFEHFVHLNIKTVVTSHLLQYKFNNLTDSENNSNMYRPLKNFNTRNYYVAFIKNEYFRILREKKHINKIV